MNHGRARDAVDGLFTGKATRLAELKSHLEGCGDCRSHYERTAHAFRSLSGHPDQMTAEELQLFAPAFPQQQATRARWPMVWLGALAAAAAASLVIYVQHEPPEFLPRGSTPVEAHPGTRALCSHGDPGAVVVSETCTAGDRLSFVTTPHGRRFVAVATINQSNEVELIVSGAEGSLAPGAEVVLPNGTLWRPGLRAVAIYGAAPIAPSLAEKCARDECPAALERRDIRLGSAAP